MAFSILFYYYEHESASRTPAAFVALEIVLCPQVREQDGNPSRHTALAHLSQSKLYRIQLNYRISEPPGDETIPSQMA